MNSGNSFLHHLVRANQAEELLKLEQAVKLQELGYQEMADQRYEPALQFFIVASEKFLELKKKSKNKEIVNISRIKLVTVLDEVIHFNITRLKSASILKCVVHLRRSS